MRDLRQFEFIKANGDLRKANCINLTEEYSKGILDTSNDKANGLIRFLDMGLTMDKSLSMDKATKLIITSYEEQIGHLQTLLNIKENALENLEKIVKESNK